MASGVDKKMERIARLQVVVQPFMFNDRKTELKVTVIRGREEHSVFEILDIPDLQSLFDVMFERMKQELKYRLDKNKS